MKKSIVILLSLVFCINFAKAQTTNANEKHYYSESKKHKIFFYWGYNRCAFLKSDIHFKGPVYDFKLEDVSAKDRPTPFTLKNYFTITEITIPQYDYRIGYHINEKYAISIGIDHMKYVVVQNQTAKLSGTIDKLASEKYVGVYDQKEIVVTDDFLRFEHTDGLNLVSLDLERSMKLTSFSKNRFRLNAQFGAGAGPCVPRTDAKVFGDRLNNNFHVAGWGLDAKAGLKLDILNHFFLQTEFRGGHIFLNDILIHNEQPQRANQNITFGEWYFVGGWMF
jgi:hypothetical protein